jgi:hypothetical protein
MRSFRELSQVQRIGLIAGVIFWGVAIICLETLLYPFLRKKQDVRRTVFQKPFMLSRPRLEYLRR